jgi:hypothetical protein
MLYCFIIQIIGIPTYTIKYKAKKSQIFLEPDFKHITIYKK